MKIRISYSREEFKAVSAVCALLMAAVDRLRITRSDDREPFGHVYLETKGVDRPGRK